ncbi:MAG TPA: hypothetical protein VI248_03490 [Kineosporiaceae bacterium]
MNDPSRDTDGRGQLLRDFAFDSYGDDELRGSPELEACFRPLEHVLPSLVGPGTRLRYTPRGTQVALRFPGPQGYAHLDGLGLASNGDRYVPSAIVIVYLADVGPDDSPFTAWPEAFPRVQDLAWESLAGRPEEEVRQELVDLVYGQTLTEGAESLVGPAGSTFLAHPALPHCGGPGIGADIRYATLRRMYPTWSFAGSDLLPQTWPDAMRILAAGPGELAPIARTVRSECPV